MKHASKSRPTHKGQKFKALGEVLTVDCFYSEDGNEYDTYLACQKASPGKAIHVKNSEYGGGCCVSICELI